MVSFSINCMSDLVLKLNVLFSKDDSECAFAWNWNSLIKTEVRRIAIKWTRSVWTEHFFPHKCCYVLERAATVCCRIMLANPGQICVSVWSGIERLQIAGHHKTCGRERIYRCYRCHHSKDQWNTFKCDFLFQFCLKNLR